LQSLRFRLDFALHSLCNRFAIALHSLGNRLAIALISFAITSLSLCEAKALVINNILLFLFLSSFFISLLFHSGLRGETEKEDGRRGEGGGAGRVVRSCVRAASKEEE
jgi:hypothetical protein